MVFPQAPGGAECRGKALFFGSAAKGLFNGKSCNIIIVVTSCHVSHQIGGSNLMNNIESFMIMGAEAESGRRQQSMKEHRLDGESGRHKNGFAFKFSHAFGAGFPAS